jgi:hypothetical protein
VGSRCLARDWPHVLRPLLGKSLYWLAVSVPLFVKRLREADTGMDKSDRTLLLRCLLSFLSLMKSVARVAAKINAPVRNSMHRFHCCTAGAGLKPPDATESPPLCHRFRGFRNSESLSCTQIPQSV